MEFQMILGLLKGNNPIFYLYRYPDSPIPIKCDWRLGIVLGYIPGQKSASSNWVGLHLSNEDSISSSDTPPVLIIWVFLLKKK